MSRYREWLATLADDRKNATSPKMWLGTTVLVLCILILTAYIHPVSDWFGLRFWPSLFYFIPCLLLGVIGGHLEQRGKLSLHAWGALALVGNAYLQFFFAMLIVLSRPPGSFALASLFVLTVAFHGYVMRATRRYPYPAIGTLLAIVAAEAIDPSDATTTVLAFVAPTSLLISLLTGSAGLREHKDRREREKLRQAIHYRALNERTEETSRMSERVLDLLRYNHDAGNTLSSVFLNAQVVEERLHAVRAAIPDASELDVSMQRLLEQLSRLKGLISSAHRIADELPGTSEARVQPIVEEAVTECRLLFPNVALSARFQLAGEPSVFVHEGEIGLRRVIQNVLHNACEGDGTYAAANVSVAISADGDTVQLRVTDDGPGFRPEQLGERVRPLVTTKANGHGLGLYNVNELVEASGGSLERGNLSERGAAVVVRLRLSRLTTSAFALEGRASEPDDESIADVEEASVA